MLEVPHAPIGESGDVDDQAQGEGTMNINISLSVITTINNYGGVIRCCCKLLLGVAQMNQVEVVKGPQARFIGERSGELKLRRQLSFPANNSSLQHTDRQTDGQTDRHKVSKRN